MNGRLGLVCINNDGTPVCGGLQYRWVEDDPQISQESQASA